MMIAALSLYVWDSSRSEAARTLPVNVEELPQQTDERIQATSKPTEKREPGKPKNSNAALPSSAPANSANSVTAPTSLETRASLHPMETVTLTIDPANGLLATSNCPNKTSMTYVKGQEPHQFCTAHNHSHEPASSSEREDKSRLKSFVNRVASPSKWFQKKKEANGNQGLEH
jgi:hypothetical protein